MRVIPTGHHAGDVGPPPAWGGLGDDVNGPCAIAGEFSQSTMSAASHNLASGVACPSRYLSH